MSAITLIDGYPDEDGPGRELVEDSDALEAAILDIEHLINTAPHIGTRALKNTLFNLDIPIGSPLSPYESNDPYRRLGSLGLN